MGGRQIAILGKHPSGGSYLWPDGFGPERLATPSDDWWDLTVEFSKKFDRKRPISIVSTSSGDWVRTIYCEICNRDERTICSKHKDGNSIRCFYGGTFSPPTGLKDGSILIRSRNFFSRLNWLKLNPFDLIFFPNPVNRIFLLSFL